MAITIKGNQFTAPRARFEYNGIVIAWATSVRFGHMHQRDEMGCIGSLEKLDDVPLAYRPSFSASQFQLADTSPVTLGMTPDIGQNSEQHLLALLQIGDATAVLTDKVTGNITGLIEGILMSSQDMGIVTASMVSADQQFSCRRVHYFGSQAAS